MCECLSDCVLKYSNNQAIKQSVLREFFDSLFFAATADEDLAAFLGDDKSLQSLQHYLLGIFGMDHTVFAFVEVYVANGAVAVRVK